MKVAKIIVAEEPQEIIIIAVENGKEVEGQRTEQQLYDEGFKKLCECGEDGEKFYIEYPDCIIEIVKHDDEERPE